jgi:hypothetical protein
VSDGSDYVPKRAHNDDDAISLSASDNDIQALLDGSPATGDNATSDQNRPDTTGNTAQLAQVQQPPGDPSELELIESLSNALNEEEKTGPKVVQNLADIAMTRWGKTITPDKLKAMLSKHDKPENCTDLTVPKVNSEIWSTLNNFKKSADLRLSNIQQVVEKATFGMIKACDTLLTTPTNTKLALSHSIDSIALMHEARGGRTVANTEGPNQTDVKTRILQFV